MEGTLSYREKLAALHRVLLFNPALTVGIAVMSFFTAILEGIGLGFLFPIIDIARGSETGETSRFVEVFVQIYSTLDVPFTLTTVIVGVAFVITARYVSSFVVAWLKHHLKMKYVRHIQTQAFEHALDARVGYFDENGSDVILNTIVTQSKYARDLIAWTVQLIKEGLLTLMYFSIALYIAPMLTLFSAVALGGITLLLRSVLESGYSVGDRVAAANEDVQEAAQAGTQGIRDVKLFNLTGELFEDFREAVNTMVYSTIKLRRNQEAMNNFYELATSLSIFVLIYVALVYTSLTLAGLGVFLFTMFRLAPRVSGLNNLVYKIEGNLPHLVRTQEFIEDLERHGEENTGTTPVPDRIESFTFDDVTFSYGEERILDGISFGFDRDEFVAFVGPSGAGKSTIVSLLARMYRPDSGQILADGEPINEFDIDEWRSRISVVRQQPFVFNDTLRYNVTVGNRGASEAEIREVCEIAKVDQFLDDMPDGLDTVLGDDGVRLSGGQRQRVAIARALLKEDIDLLIFDEATSDLDSHLEAEVHDRIESMDRDYAMVVIAHRLSTVTQADDIHVMEDGRIIETGTHGDLISRDGTYASLYATQTQ